MAGLKRDNVYRARSGVRGAIRDLATAALDESQPITMAKLDDALYGVRRATRRLIDARIEIGVYGGDDAKA